MDLVNHTMDIQRELGIELQVTDLDKIYQRCRDRVILYIADPGPMRGSNRVPRGSRSMYMNRLRTPVHRPHRQLSRLHTRARSRTTM